jgi:hypothetical protein
MGCALTVRVRVDSLCCYRGLTSIPHEAIPGKILTLFQPLFGLAANVAHNTGIFTLEGRLGDKPEYGQTTQDRLQHGIKIERRRSASLPTLRHCTQSIT